MRKWRWRGPDDCADHSSRPQRLLWKATEAERAIVCAVREATRFLRDDLTFTLRHFLPHRTRDSVYPILQVEQLHRLADLPPIHAHERPRRGQGHFRTYDLGFVHLAVKDDTTERSALAFLDEAVAALPFRIRYPAHGSRVVLHG